MARLTTVRELVGLGKLRTGTKLQHKGRRNEDSTAIVVQSGLQVRGATFRTPSAAARSITGKPVDGWTFWKLPDGRPLASLR